MAWPIRPTDDSTHVAHVLKRSHECERGTQGVRAPQLRIPLIDRLRDGVGFTPAQKSDKV